MTASRSDAQVFDDPDMVASAFGLTWGVLGAALEVGWAREVAGAVALVTHTPVAGLNGVWAPGSDWDAAQVRAMLADVAREGVPFCLQARPGNREKADRLAAEMGMSPEHAVPLMVATEVPEAPKPDGLSLRALSAGEARLHCELAGPAFGGTPDLFATFMTEAIFAHPQVRGYVGEVDGEPVVTAVTVAMGAAVGIFNVATPETHRRRGYGHAITALAAREGFDRGAKFAWLQASAAGYRVYERLGFTTVERWLCWVAQGRP